jgi:L-iditol 2-dehydrogenase
MGLFQQPGDPVRAILPLAAGGFGLAEVPTPGIGTGEILVEMRACGLCGTDLAKLAHPRQAAGIRLGHEFAGVVVAVGPEVTCFAPGDRVTAAHHVPCGTCRACRHGSESMCPQFKMTQIDPCGFAEFIRLPALHVERVTFRLPELMSFETASFTEPLGCAVRAVERSAVQAGDRIAVVGGGGMGLLIAQAVRAREAEPIVLDISEERLQVARRLGIAGVVNPATDDPRRRLAALTDGAGLDGAILTVVTEGILGSTQEALRAGGRINVFAEATGEPRHPLDLADLYHRELTLTSTYSSTPATLARAFDLLADGRVRVDTLISHRLSLDEFEEGVRLQRSGRAIKVVFHP